jgi:methionyl-tRNA formyltransferase
MGTPEFAATVLGRLVSEPYTIVAVVCQPDKPIGRHMKLTPPPVKTLAESRGIPVLQPTSLRTPDFLAQISEIKPDLIVTAAYGKILPQAVLDVPSYGCLNVHASLLPRHRGAAPIQWAILAGDAETGITVMKMDAGMDTGDILTVARTPIGEDTTTAELTGTLASLGASLLAETIPSYISGNITPIRQDDALVTLSPPIRKEQGMLDWSLSAQDIHNRVRALSTWPGAYTYLDGSRIKIFTSAIDRDGCARKLDYEKANGIAKPGTIVFASKTELSVACGDGCISLLCVQPDSSKRLNVCDCAHNYRAGLCFGEEVL